MLFSFAIHLDFVPEIDVMKNLNFLPYRRFEVHVKRFQIVNFKFYELD